MSVTPSPAPSAGPSQDAVAALAQSLGIDPNALGAQIAAMGGGGASTDLPVYWGVNPNGTLVQKYASVKGSPRGHAFGNESADVLTPTDKTMLQSQSYMYVDNMAANDPAEYNKIKNLVIAAGLTSNSPDPKQVDNAWQWAVDKAAQYYQSGKKLTPFDVLDLYATQNGPATVGKSVTSHSVNITSAADATAAYQSTARDMIGRQPTAGEAAGATAALNAAEQANPSTTTTTYDAQGNSNSVSTGGLGASAATEILRQQAMQNPDYGAYQAATTYFNALQSLLGPANSTGG